MVKQEKKDEDVHEHKKENIEEVYEDENDIELCVDDVHNLSLDPWTLINWWMICDIKV